MTTNAKREQFKASLNESLTPLYEELDAGFDGMGNVIQAIYSKDQNIGSFSDRSVKALVENTVKQGTEMVSNMRLNSMNSLES